MWCVMSYRAADFVEVHKRPSTRRPLFPVVVVAYEREIGPIAWCYSDWFAQRIAVALEEADDRYRFRNREQLRVIFGEV